MNGDSEVRDRFWAMVLSNLSTTSRNIRNPELRNHAPSGRDWGFGFRRHQFPNPRKKPIGPTHLAGQTLNFLALTQPLHPQILTRPHGEGHPIPSPKATTRTSYLKHRPSFPIPESHNKDLLPNTSQPQSLARTLAELKGFEAASGVVPLGL